MLSSRALNNEDPILVTHNLEIYPIPNNFQFTYYLEIFRIPKNFRVTRDLEIFPNPKNFH
mgnify:CR=1